MQWFPNSIQKIFELALENKSLFEEKAAKKGVEINIQVEMETFVLVDRNMITTVMRNLISNAVKFTNSGDKIEISTKKDIDQIEIIIKDTGIGIPEKNIGQIFRIDSNFSTQGTAEEVGTGLGLIISREFVEKNGGTINVKSTEGEGSQFVFTVPTYKE